NISNGGALSAQILYVDASDSTFASNNVSGNTITAISNGNANLTGITTGAFGGSHNFFKNKVCNLTRPGAAATTHGMVFTGGVTENVFNNLIGDLKAPTTSSTTDAVRGINITSTTAASTLN